MLAEKHDEILEAIWTSNENNESSISVIRERCVTDINDEDLSKLAEEGLISRKDDKVFLSESGKKMAAGIIRRHRLAEVLLSSILNLNQDKMEEIACKVEHSLIPEVEESICTLLGHPEICPDGKPIPSGTCCTNGLKVSDSMVVNLSQLKPSERGKITYIKPVSHSNFHQLMSFGLHPGVVVTVHRTTPAFCIKFENTELALDKNIASNIFVWKLKPGH